jgi:hypothetical protein
MMLPHQRITYETNGRCVTAGIAQLPHDLGRPAFHLVGGDVLDVRVSDQFAPATADGECSR